MTWAVGFFTGAEILPQGPQSAGTSKVAVFQEESLKSGSIQSFTSFVALADLV